MSTEIVTRRVFITYATAAGSVMAFAPGMSLAHSWACVSTFVVSFHLDQPFVDFSGQCQPYRPPAGCRSGEPLANLSDTEFYSCKYGA